MKRIKRLLKKARNLFSRKRRERLEQALESRARKGESYSRNLELLNQVLRRNNITLSEKDRRFLEILSGKALSEIYTVVEHTDAPTYVRWQTEGCLSFYRRVREGEKPQPIERPGGYMATLYAYVADYVEKRKALEK